jgi:hypothetical protein
MITQKLRLELCLSSTSLLILKYCSQNDKTMNIIIPIGTTITIALLIFTIAIVPPMSTSAQNMTDNMTSSNTTQGAAFENMTGVGGISSLEGGGGGGGSGSGDDGGEDGGGSGNGGIEGGGGGGGSGFGGSAFIYN